MSSKALTAKQQIITEFFNGHGIIAPEFEYRFHEKRKWRMDIAFPEHLLFIEVQGGIWTNGRHVRGAALLKEWEKLNTAASMGWRVLFVQPSDICSGDFISQVKTALSCQLRELEN